jgi:hypothetical protein
MHNSCLAATEYETYPVHPTAGCTATTHSLPRLPPISHIQLDDSIVIMTHIQIVFSNSRPEQLLPAFLAEAAYSFTSSAHQNTDAVTHVPYCTALHLSIFHASRLCTKTLLFHAAHLLAYGTTALLSTMRLSVYARRQPRCDTAGSCRSRIYVMASSYAEQVRKSVLTTEWCAHAICATLVRAHCMHDPTDKLPSLCSLSTLRLTASGWECGGKQSLHTQQRSRLNQTGCLPSRSLQAGQADKPGGAMKPSTHAATSHATGSLPVSTWRPGRPRQAAEPPTSRHSR